MMKLPKTVNISGKIYTVGKDKSSWGGSCATGKQTIAVGTARDRSSQRTFTTFVHEVSEAVCLERRLRYEASDDEAIFVMSHKQFADYCMDVATALWPIVKK